METTRWTGHVEVEEVSYLAMADSGVPPTSGVSFLDHLRFNHVIRNMDPVYRVLANSPLIGRSDRHDAR